MVSNGGETDEDDEGRPILCTRTVLNESRITRLEENPVETKILMD